jgi:F0F1-type ATP synthase assembly protein I
MMVEDRGHRGWIRFYGIGFEFVAAVVGFTLVGYWVDRHYGSSPAGILVGLALGLIGATYNLIRSTKIASDMARRDDAEAKSENAAEGGGRDRERRP